MLHACGFAFFVWQNMKFANSQMKMAKLKESIFTHFP